MRIPCKRLRATLVEPASALPLSLGRSPSTADRWRRCSLHGSRSVLRTAGVAAPSLFLPPRFSSVSSFVTRAARRRDIASFHLQPHPLIPLVGVACNSSESREKIDAHRLCRSAASFSFRTLPLLPSTLPPSDKTERVN